MSDGGVMPDQFSGMPQFSRLRKELWKESGGRQRRHGIAFEHVRKKYNTKAGSEDMEGSPRGTGYSSCVVITWSSLTGIVYFRYW